MCDLDKELTRTNGIDDVLSHRFLLHAVGKLLRGLVVDIGLQQGLTDILDRLGDINLRDTAFTFENLKRPF